MDLYKCAHLIKMSNHSEMSRYEDATTRVYKIHKKLLQYVLKCSNSVRDEKTTQKVLILCAKLIQTLLQYSILDVNESPIIVSQEVSKILSTLVTVSQMPNIKNVLVRKLAPVVFETISDPCINGWCGKEILKNFNVIIQNSDKSVRHELIADNNLMHLYKLVDLLSVCGDYNYQTVIVECIYRMCSKEMLIKYSNDLIPEDDELRKTFLSIKNQTFDGDVRTFLNMLNKKSKSVYSIVSDVYLDDVSLIGPFEYKLKNGSLWVDFNIKFKSISWYVDESFYDCENHELLILSAQSVENSTVEMMDTDKIKISFELKGEIITQLGTVIKNPKHVHLITQKTEKAEFICSKIIQEIFETNSSDVFYSASPGSQGSKRNLPFHREDSVKNKKYSNSKCHMLTEQSNVIEITSDEKNTELTEIIDVRDPDSMVFPGNTNSIVAYKSATYSTEVLEHNFSSKKKKCTRIHKGRNSQYLPNIPKQTEQEIRSGAVSPISLAKCIFEEELRQFESEYYTAQIDCSDDRIEQKVVQEVGLETELLIQSRHVRSETVMNEVASVDSEIQRVNTLEPFKSSISGKHYHNIEVGAIKSCFAKAKNVVNNNTRPFQRQQRKIRFANLEKKQSCSSSSDTVVEIESEQNESDKYMTCKELLSEKISDVANELPQAVKSNDHVLKRTLDIDESETPDHLDIATEDSVEDAASVIILNEITQQNVGSPDRGKFENDLALQAKAVDENKNHSNKDEEKQFLLEATTVENLPNNDNYIEKTARCLEDLHKKCGEVMLDESIKLNRLSENGGVLAVGDDEELEEGVGMVLRLPNVSIEKLLPTDKCFSIENQVAVSSQHKSNQGKRNVVRKPVIKNTELQQINSYLITSSEDVTEDDKSSNLSSNISVKSDSSKIVENDAPPRVRRPEKAQVPPEQFVSIDSVCVYQETDGALMKYESKPRQTLPSPKNCDPAKDNSKQEAYLKDMKRDAMLNVRRLIVKVERCDFSRMLRNTKIKQSTTCKDEDLSRKQKEKCKNLRTVEDDTLLCTSDDDVGSLCKIIRKAKGDEEPKTVRNELKVDKNQTQTEDIPEDNRVRAEKSSTTGLNDKNIAPESKEKPSSAINKYCSVSLQQKLNQKQFVPFLESTTGEVIPENTKLQQTNNQLTVLSEDEDLSSPLIVNRKQYKKNKVVPVIEDDTPSIILSENSVVEDVPEIVKNGTPTRAINTFESGQKSPEKRLNGEPVPIKKLSSTAKENQKAYQQDDVSHNKHGSKQNQTLKNVDFSKDNANIESRLNDIIRNAKLNLRRLIVKVEQCDFSKVIQNADVLQPDNQQNTDFKNEDLLLVIDRKPIERVTTLPVVKDDKLPENKKGNDKEADLMQNKRKTDENQKGMFKDRFEDNRIEDKKLSLIKLNPEKTREFTEKLFSSTDRKQVKCVILQDVSQKHAVRQSNLESRGEKLSIISSQNVQANKDSAISPVIVMARDKIEHLRNQGNVEKTYPRICAIETVNKAVIEAPSKEIMVNTPISVLHKNLDDQLQEANVFQESMKIQEKEDRQHLVGNNVSEFEDGVEEIRNETTLNMTKATTTSSRRRKLFDPNDLSYMESLPNIKEDNEKRPVKIVKSNSQKENKTFEQLLPQKHGNGVKRKLHQLHQNQFRSEHRNKKIKQSTGTRKTKKIVCDWDKILEAIRKFLEEERNKGRMKANSRKGMGRSSKEKQERKLQRSFKRKLNERESARKRQLCRKAKVDEYPLSQELIEEIGTAKEDLLVPNENKVQVISHIVLRKAEQPLLKTVPEAVNEKADHESISILENSNAPMRLNKYMVFGNGYFTG